ncbi:MAG: hypothetical protein Q4Q07_00845 [Tissierellia bacterium]|nr:hypothetical protein [Tissierellia bacterium]
MKKILPTIVLGVALIVTGCTGGNEGKNTENANNKVNTVNVNNEEGKNTNTEALDNEKNAENTNEDGNEKNKETTNNNLSATDNKELTKDQLYDMMVKSDYISRVKLTRLGDNDTELKVLENYKGSLSNIEFPVPKGLKTDREYLLFFHDDEEGNVTPTNGNMSFIEVAPTNDTILEYVEATYKKDEPEEDSTKTKDKGSESKKSTEDKKDN